MDGEFGMIYELYISLQSVIWEDLTHFWNLGHIHICGLWLCVLWFEGRETMLECNGW